ncbi:hypothetical protein EMCRGX_G024607 [Ephydatia muelleri]
MRFRNAKLVTVEPVVFLYMFATYLLVFVMPLYVINRYQTESLVAALKKNLSVNNTVLCTSLAYPKNQSFVCISNQDLANCSNSSGSDGSVVERSTTLILLANVAGQLPSVFVALISGPMSDRVGRKPLMVALSLAGVLSAGVVLAIMYLDLSVYYFVLCYFINSLGGGSTGLFFSYLADISSPRWITYRIGFAEGMLVLSIALCTAAGGAWIGSSNCYYPYIAWLMLASYLAVLLYVLVFLPESLAREERQRRHAIAGHRSGLRSVFRGLEIVFMPGHSRWRISTHLYTLGIIYLIATGLSSVNTLYFTHSPLQWGSELIGLYNATFFLTHGAALIFLLPILVTFKLHDSIISLVGMTFSALMAILNIFVQRKWQMFAIGTVVGLEAIAAPPMRSMLSASVNPSDQGAIFSVVAVVQSICSMIGTVVFLLTYSHILTAGWPAGTVFSLTAFFAASTLPLSIVLFLCRNKKGAKYEAPPISEEKKGLLIPSSL